MVGSGIPKPDGIIIPASAFLNKELRKNGKALTGNVIVRYTMNMGFWENGKEVTPALGNEVIVMGADNEAMVSGEGRWNLSVHTCKNML